MMMLTEKEIFNQYEALKKTIALVKLRADGVRTLAEECKPRAIVFTGCGSSFSLSCSFRTIASMRLPLPVYAVAAGDLWLNAQRYQAMVRDALILSVSRSGKTSELVKAYEAVKALNVNASFLSVVCCEDTPVEALSDVTLCMPWAFDSSVCQTRCVSNLYAAGAMLVGALAGDGSIMAGMERVAVLGDAYLKLADALARRLAKTPWENVVVLADGEIDGLAEEAALAFKEISQLPSNYYHMLDVRHGPMVLIDEKTLVYVVLKSPACQYEMSLVKDIAAKGAQVVCYSNMPVKMPEEMESITLGEDVGYVAGGLGLVALCQLTSYHKSFEMGCNPDQPDGLRPWIEIV